MEQHKQDLTFLFVDQGQDWSIKAINAAIEKKGTTLPSLSLSSGLVEGSLRNAFYRHCPKYEQIIANFIGVEPSVIWPSRYLKSK
ncbi:helix-turn-helix domain-containing protein [Symbiopectobacterium sp. Eva_TO]